MEFPHTDPNLTSGILSIAATILAYLVCHFARDHGWFGNRASVLGVLYRRLLGTLVFGLTPFLVIVLVFRRSVEDYGFASGSFGRSVLWWIPMAAVLVFIMYFWSRTEKNLEMYPQMRVGRWTPGLMALSALSWITYLLGYEFLFRGFLLFACLESFGYWPAVILNLCLYSLAHLRKGSGELIGSLVFGFLLCTVTLHLGSAWFAVLAHITMALSNEWFSLQRHPGMQLEISRSER